MPRTPPVFGRIRLAIDVTFVGDGDSENPIGEGVALVRALAAGRLDGATHRDLVSSIPVIIEVASDRSVVA